LPGVLWLAYFFFRRGRWSISFGNVCRVFLWGCACTIPAGLLEHITDARVDHEGFAWSAAASFLLVAPIEEFFKLASVWIAIYRSPDFKEPGDGLFYAATAAIGFASVENLIYAFFLGPKVVLLRLFFATPAHILFASMWGYAMGLARFERSEELTTILKGLAASIGLHGAYDTLAALNRSGNPLALVPVIALIGLMGWIAYRLARELRRRRRAPIGQGAIVCCPTCGALTLENDMRCCRCEALLPLIETDAVRYCGTCRAVLTPGCNVCARCGDQIDLSRLWPPAA
jgi:RsiW-degrading membrane proteinase PrsW (M82 family)